MTYQERLKIILEDLSYAVSPDEDGCSPYDSVEEQEEARREAVRKAQDAINALNAETIGSPVNITKPENLGDLIANEIVELSVRRGMNATISKLRERFGIKK